MELNLSQDPQEEKQNLAEPEKESQPKMKTPDNRKFKQKISDFFKNPKKRLIFEIVLGVILIAVFGIGIYSMTKDTAPSAKTEKKKEAKIDETKYSAILDGMMTDKAASERHPLAIVVENDTAARPQSGLDKASIVYETVYDPAATTRFLAIFGTEEAEKVGPIRSARTFFVDWAHGYDAYLAHWGGNADALDQIRAEKTYDLDEFAYPGPFWRESGKSLEHTGYTSTIKLRQQASDNKYPTANNFSVYKFKEDPADLPAAQTISVNYSNASYKVDFVYDKTTNSYKRDLAGKAHEDAVTKNQLKPKNIVIMTVARKQTTTRINEAGYSMTTTGSGKAKIFLDGKQIDGTWKKESASDREIFYDQTGAEVVFNRGQMWICVVADEKVVTIK